MRIASLVLEFVTFDLFNDFPDLPKPFARRLLANAFGVAQARASIHPLSAAGIREFRECLGPPRCCRFCRKFLRVGPRLFMDSAKRTEPASVC